MQIVYSYHPLKQAKCQYMILDCLFKLIVEKCQVGHGNSTGQLPT